MKRLTLVLLVAMSLVVAFAPFTPFRYTRTLAETVTLSQDINAFSTRINQRTAEGFQIERVLDLGTGSIGQVRVFVFTRSLPWYVR